MRRKRREGSYIKEGAGGERRGTVRHIRAWPTV
jgi:hypothetical protein